MCRYLTAVACSAVAVVPLCCVAAAQNANDVHVQPRQQADVASSQRSESALKTHTKPFISNVDVVLVPVIVTDPLTRLVSGLERQHFRLYDNRKPQEIEYFYTQDAPISVGIIFDQSGSMRGAIDGSREAAVEFLKASNPDDEFFLIAFSDKPQIVGDFTENLADIQGELLFTVPRGRTALWDAVYLGLNKMRTAKYSKKALLVISDGGENHSRYSYKEMQRVVREADVQIFGIGIPGADYGPSDLAGIAQATGGRLFEGPPNTFPDTMEKIAVELRNQYVLGYRPKGLARDGKYHKINVKLLPPRGLPPLNVGAKKNGYYAPEE